MRTINPAGLDLVKRWEGILDGDPTTVNLNPYLDPVGIWTIGWGHAIRDLRGRYLRGTAARDAAFALYPVGLTLEQCEILLRADLLDDSRDVTSLAKVPLMDNQFSALVSFEFNTGALRVSTLLHRLNAGDYLGAANQFGLWVKGTIGDKKVTLPGLVKRRAAERALFLST
jgi:lysozyme